MDNIISLVLLVLITMIAVAIVLSSAIPAVNSAEKSAEIKSAESAMQFISNAIDSVIAEGQGASRRISMVVPPGFESVPEEDAIVYSTAVDFELMEYLSRKPSGGILYISGSDVNCFEGDENGDGSADLVMENSMLRAAFTKVNRTEPKQAINTNNSFISVKEKTGGIAINFTNTSLYVNNFSSSAGTGYSEISKSGRNMPHCQVHFFINSSVVYDVYFKLYAGADFIVAEVRNIR